MHGPWLAVPYEGDLRSHIKKQVLLLILLSLLLYHHHHHHLLLLFFVIKGRRMPHIDGVFVVMVVV